MSPTWLSCLVLRMTGVTNPPMIPRTANHIMSNFNDNTPAKMVTTTISANAIGWEIKS